jgi:hypothetical protein
MCGGGSSSGVKRVCAPQIDSDRGAGGGSVGWGCSGVGWRGRGRAKWWEQQDDGIGPDPRQCARAALKGQQGLVDELLTSACGQEWARSLFEHHVVGQIHHITTLLREGELAQIAATEQRARPQVRERWAKSCRQAVNLLREAKERVDAKMRQRAQRKDRAQKARKTRGKRLLDQARRTQKMLATQHCHRGKLVAAGTARTLA